MSLEPPHPHDKALWMTLEVKGLKTEGFKWKQAVGEKAKKEISLVWFDKHSLQPYLD